MRLDRIFSLISFVSMSLLGLYVLTVSINVISRYVFHYPLPILSDMAELLVPAGLALAFPAAAFKGSHLSIRFLGSVTGPGGAFALELFGRVATIALMSAITWKLIEYAQELAAAGRSTTLYDIPIWPVWAFVAGAFALSVVGALVAPLTVTSPPDGLDPAQSPD